MNIKFYDSVRECITNFEQLSIIKKITSIIMSYVNFFRFHIKESYSDTQNDSQSIDKYILEPSLRTLSNGNGRDKLIVCLHGLGRDYCQFNELIRELEKTNLANTTIYIPNIIEKGSAKLDSMIEPIVKEIQLWAINDKYRDKFHELILIGISNGGRIARAIEANISIISNIKKIHFVSIVGACNGSSTADLANKLGLSFLVSKAISEEMPTRSARSIQLNNDWINSFNNCTNINREYTFIASPHDFHVPNKSSTLMEVPAQANVITRYAIILNHGHLSIVDAVAKSITDLICDI